MENSCRKKYKPSSKKWISASRCTRFRRNPALIPANAGLFHYAGNNPVRYIDPTGQFEIDSHNPNRIFANLDDADDLMNAAAYLQSPNSGYTVTAYGENSGITKNFTNYGEILDYANIQNKQTDFLYFHFEGRNKRNIITESFNEIYKSSQSKNGDWTLLSYGMSILHQNGIGSDELKFICKDGREAVFTKDFSKDGSYELYTDPRYMGTYNYCNPVPFPESITDVKGMTNFVGKSVIGHGCLDVIPYYITGKRNVRD